MLSLIFCQFHRKNEAAEKPKREFVPKTLSDLGVTDTLNGGIIPGNMSGKHFSLLIRSNYFILL